MERTKLERVGRYTSDDTGNQRTYLYDNNGAYDYTGPEVTDEDEGGGSRTFGEDISFQDVTDGEIALGDVEYVVYEVSGCDGYASGQIEVVFAPPMAAFYIPAAEATLNRILPIPELEFTPFDEESEWTYVQAPIDSRTNAASLAPVSFVVDSGGPNYEGGVQIRRWLAIEAKPSFVIFGSGDPLAEQTPGACSYQFRNGSSVTGSSRFDAELRVEWDVEFTRNDGKPGMMDVDPTINAEEIAVAEVKAVTQYAPN